MKDEKNITRAESSARELMQNASQAVNTDAIWASIEGRVPKQKDKRRGILWLWLGTCSIIVALGLIWILADSTDHSGNDYASMSDDTVMGSTSVSTKTWGLASDTSLSNDRERAITDQSETTTGLHQAPTSLSQQSTPSASTTASNTLVKNVAAAIKGNAGDVDITISQMKAATNTSSAGGSSTSKGNITGPAHQTGREILLAIDPILLSPLSAMATKLVVSPPSQYIVRDLDRPIIDEVILLSGVNLSTWRSSGLSTVTDHIEEQGMPSYQAQALFKKRLKKGWSAGLSLGLRSAISRVNDTSERIQQTTVNGVESITISNGVQTETNGQVRETNIYNERYVLHRRQNNYTVGADLYYDLVSNRRINISTRFGGGLSIASKATGYGFSSEGVIVDNGANTSDYNQTSPYMTGGLLISYDLGSWSIVMSGDIHHRLGASIVTPTYQIKNTQAGLSLGIAYRPTWDL